jgi:histidinol dehydrogenase
MSRVSLMTELRTAAEAADQGTADLLRRAADRIDALHKEMSEAERDFQREARDIAAESRWDALNERNGDPYGTY